MGQIISIVTDVHVLKYYDIYILLMSSLGFVLMGTDKRKAIKNAWRIPERTLLTVAILGGGIGSFIGMHVFHHKTKHLKFVIILPIAALIDVAILIKLIL